MQFIRLFSLVAVTGTAVQATSHITKKHDATARSPEPLGVNAGAGVTVNVTGVGESLVTLLTDLGRLGDEGSNIIGDLLNELLEGGSGALNQTAHSIAGVLGESPAVAEALHNILGTIEICAS